MSNHSTGHPLPVIQMKYGRNKRLHKQNFGHEYSHSVLTCWWEAMMEKWKCSKLKLLCRFLFSWLVDESVNCGEQLIYMLQITESNVLMTATVAVWATGGNHTALMPDMAWSDLAPMPDVQVATVLFENLTVETVRTWPGISGSMCREFCARCSVFTKCATYDWWVTNIELSTRIYLVASQLCPASSPEKSIARSILVKSRRAPAQSGLGPGQSRPSPVISHGCT